MEDRESNFQTSKLDKSLYWKDGDDKDKLRQRRIENLASSIKVSGPTTAKVVRRPEMNMEIDTLRLVLVVLVIPVE